tara:strand:- start:889 stop:1098 length:210 start_codon:yes stop_codon:yes gene_type:complete
MLWSFKSCGKCGGDLVMEGDEWRCIHCGRYYYPNVTQLRETETTLFRSGTPSDGVAGQVIDTMSAVAEA